MTLPFLLWHFMYLQSAFDYRKCVSNIYSLIKISDQISIQINDQVCINMKHSCTDLDFLKSEEKKGEEENGQ